MGGVAPDHTVINRVDPLVGVTIDGRYRVETRLAQGGFGAIYRAHDTQLKRAIALKVLHQRFVADGGTVARFRREGATLTALKSPYTIAAYAIGESTEHGLLYIAMELLHGVSLYERFRVHGPIPWRTMAKITRQICHALAEAHELGIVHRDLKPTNIHLEDINGDKDHVKVLDFGIAKILQAGQASTLESADLTNVGQMIGTLDYMSPEQMVGGALTGQTDIYTVGIVTYEMIAGKRPFAEAPTVAGVLAAMLKTKPPSLARIAGVPAELDRIVQRCLSRKVEDRYRDVILLGADLDMLLAAQPDEADSTRQMVVDPRDLREARISDGMTAVTMFSGVEMPGVSGESTVISGPPMTTLPGVQPPDHVRERLAKLAEMPPFVPQPADDDVTVLNSRNPLLPAPPRAQAQPPTPSPSIARPPNPAPMHVFPPAPYPMYQQPPPPSRLRELMTRRAVWIAVLVCAAMLGIGLAARCS